MSPLFGYSEEDLRRARWRVVEALRRGLRRQVFWAPEAEGVVERLLGDVGAGDAEVWAERVGMGLREALEGEVQARRMLEAEAGRLRWEVERLRGVVERYEREAPAERLRALEAEREGLRREVERLRERVRVLEEARAREAAMHQEAVRELEEKVRACNRVIVQQQEELNALRGRKRGKALSEDED